MVPGADPQLPEGAMGSQLGTSKQTISSPSKAEFYCDTLPQPLAHLFLYMIKTTLYFNCLFGPFPNSPFPLSQLRSFTITFTLPSVCKQDNG